MDAPSFSLGLDFDIDSEPQQPDSGLDPFTSCNLDTAHLSSSNALLHSIQEEDENADDCTDPTTELELEVPDPDRPLRRLRRGPASEAPLSKKVCVEVDDDIEEFSSQEDPFPDSNAKHPFSVCSSSKLSLRRRGVLSSQKTHDSKAIKINGVPNMTASASTSANNKAVLPKLTVSPLRKFQLMDSDSDFDECYLDKDVNQEVSPVNARQPDLAHVPTPAFDEILEEYFKPTKSTNCNSAPQNHGESSYQTQSLYEDNVQQSDLGTLPPAHLYYFHKDPMIQKLVRARLPNFVPLHTKSNVDHMQQNACGIDYMSQFGHGESSKQAKQKEIKQPSASRSQKNVRKTNVQEFSQGSQSWVNPRSREIPKDAGKRRVQAASKSGSGHWYFDNGRRVYVANNGQELTGQAAYMQYKKESGGGSKKSKKKTYTKKKTATAAKKK